MIARIKNHHRNSGFVSSKGDQIDCMEDSVKKINRIKPSDSVDSLKPSDNLNSLKPSRNVNSLKLSERVSNVEVKPVSTRPQVSARGIKISIPHRETFKIFDPKGQRLTNS